MKSYIELTCLLYEACEHENWHTINKLSASVQTLFCLRHLSRKYGLSNEQALTYLNEEYNIDVRELASL